MEEQRLIQLLTRKLAGEASDGELIELNELIAKYPDTLHTEAVFENIWHSKVEEENVDFFYKRHKKKYRYALGADDEDVPAGEALKHKARIHLVVNLCILLLLALAGYLFIYPPGYGTVPARTQIISGTGVRKSVKLPDGTNVWLNADSKLSFEAGMKGNGHRAVELEGEAYFDVVYREGSPFLIHTDKVTVKVLGTAFNIRAYPDDSISETTLIRGAIELSTNEGSGQKFTLKPSEKFSIIGRTKGKTALKRNDDTAGRGSTVFIEHIAPVKLANKEYVPETSWTENKLVFNNETLESLAPLLERWFNVKISIIGKPAAYRFTGIFANETIEQALAAMKLIKPFNFMINDKNITIY